MKGKRDSWVKCMPLTFSTPFGSNSPSLLLPPCWLSQKDAAEHSPGNFLIKALLLCMRDFVCTSCLKSKQTSREYPPVEQRQGYPEFWERASADWLWVGICTLWMSLGIAYVTHPQSSQSQQLQLFGCQRELSQARNICRSGSKVQEKDGNGAAPSESAELL